MFLPPSFYLFAFAFAVPGVGDVFAFDGGVGVGEPCVRSQRCGVGSFIAIDDCPLVTCHPVGVSTNMIVAA